MQEIFISTHYFLIQNGRKGISREDKYHNYSYHHNYRRKSFFQKHTIKIFFDHEE